MVSIKLKKAEFVRYSPMEQKLFELLRSKRGRPVTTEWLTLQLYAHMGREPPLSARIILTGVLRSLIKKAKINKEPFTIVRTPAQGPHSINVSIEHD